MSQSGAAGALHRPILICSHACQRTSNAAPRDGFHSWVFDLWVMRTAEGGAWKFRAPPSDQHDEIFASSEIVSVVLVSAPTARGLNPANLSSVPVRRPCRETAISALASLSTSALKADGST